MNAVAAAAGTAARRHMLELAGGNAGHRTLLQFLAGLGLLALHLTVDSQCTIVSAHTRPPCPRT